MTYCKWIFFSFVITLLSACTSKTVFVFNTGYPEPRIDNISKELVLLGYDVERVDAEIPPEFSDTAIATHPVFSAPNDLAVIQDILTKASFPSPTYYQFAQGNHFYSPKSIGLYLRNGYQKTMAPVMVGRLCVKNGKQVDATLEFFRTGDVRIETEIYSNNEYVEPTNQVLNGKYMMLSDKIKLEFPQFTTDYLPVEQITVQTYSGERQADHLVFQSKQGNTLIENCLFEAIYY